MTTLQYPLDNTTIDKFFHLKKELNTINEKTAVHYSNVSIFSIFSGLFLFFTIFLVGSTFIFTRPYLNEEEKSFFGILSTITLVFFGSTFYQNKKYNQAIKIKLQKEAQIEQLIADFYREENMQFLFQFFNDRQETYQSVFTQGTLQKAMEEMFAASKEDNFEYKQHCLNKLLRFVQQENGYENELKNSKEFQQKFKTATVAKPPAVMTEANTINNEQLNSVDLAPQYLYAK